MFSLFSRTSTKTLSLIMDIQSGLVRGALAVLSPTEPPRILYLISKPLIRPTTPVDGMYLTNLMIKAVQEVATKIAQEGFASPEAQAYATSKLDSIHYVLSSPWVISQSKTVKVEFGKDVEITEATVKDIIEKEKQTLMAKFKEGDLDEKSESDLLLVEQKIFDIKLNGYSVQDYKKKKARTFEVSFAVTTGSRYIMSLIKQKMVQILRTRTEVFHSALLLQYAGLRTLLGGRDEYVSIHVHSELTDIVIVKRGISSCLASFPFGAAALMRELAQGLKSSVETSSSSMTLHYGENLEPVEHQKLEAILAPLLASWKESCMRAIGSEGNKSSLPRLVYLSAHAQFEPFRKVLADSGFEVFPFDTAMVDKAVIFEKSSQKSTLVGMYALVVNSMV